MLPLSFPIIADSAINYLPASFIAIYSCRAAAMTFITLRLSKSSFESVIDLTHFAPALVSVLTGVGFALLALPFVGS